MDTAEVERWFGEYLETFAACGRGEADPASLLDHYGVPLLLSTDDGHHALLTAEQVVAVARRQAEGMAADGYHHSEVVEHDVTRLNATAASYRGSFVRRRADGGELGRLTATYLVTRGPDGLRISALAVHG